MATIINTSPDAVSAGYIPVTWNITSDVSDLERIIADVVIDTSIRANIDMDETIGLTDDFDVNVENVVQDYLSFDLKSISGNSIVSGGSATGSKVVVKLEIYNVTKPADILVTAWREDGTGTPDLISSNIIVTNATLQHTAAQNLDLYTVGSSAKKFLTNAPTTVTIGSSETIQLHFLTAGGGTMKWRLIQYDVDNSILSNVLQSGVSLQSNYGILLLDASTMSTNTVKFTVNLDQSGTKSEIRTFLIDSQCHSDSVRLKWVNPLGGLDSYTFTGVKQMSVMHNSKRYEKVITKGFDVEDRGITEISVTSKERFTISSKVENRTTMNWLKELIANKTNVWIDDGTNFIPIIINRGTSKILDTGNEIFRMKLKYEFSNQRITQRN